MGKGLGLGFSKSKQSSSSSSETGNHAFDFLQSQLGDTVGLAGQGGDFLSRLLMGGPEQDQAFNNFRNNSGYQFLQNEGIRNINADAAARGALHSGATLKALQDRGSSIADQSLQGYLSNLFNLSGLGLSAGGVLSDAGRYSDSESKSKGSSFSASAKFGG